MTSVPCVHGVGAVVGVPTDAVWMVVGRFDMAMSDEMDVVLLRWPEEQVRLERLRASGAPRLLLVGDELAAPEPIDSLEDWIRLPAAEGDLRVRVATLAARAVPRGPLRPPSTRTACCATAAAG